jgi:hypothetical protein
VGIVNLAYCIFDTTTLKINHWEVIKLENIKDHAKLHVSLIMELDRRKYLIQNIDTVLIEKQPSFNPKMRIIAGCLQSYFFIRGVIDSEYKIKTIKFFSPKHKLKCHNGPELVVTGKNKYTQTKKMGILICREKLYEYNEPDEIKNIFEESKKKDDLSDCYLQAITYGIFEKLIIPGNTSTSLQPIPQPPQKLTNIFLKNKFVDILSLTGDDKLEKINDIESHIKIHINKKLNIEFPLTKDSLIVLMTKLKIKKSLFQD